MMDKIDGRGRRRRETKMNTPIKIRAQRDPRFGTGFDSDLSWQLAVAAGAGWLGVAVFGGWWSAVDDDNGDGSLYLLFSIALMLSAALTVATAWVSTRPTGRRTMRKCGLGAGILAIASTIVAWAGPLWMTLLAVSFAVFAVAAPRDVRSGLAAISVGQILGIVVTVGAIKAEVGRQNSYGDYPIAADLGVVVAGVGSVIGLTLLTRAARASGKSW